MGIFLWGAEPDAWIGNQMSSGGSGGSEASVNQPTNAAGPSNANRGGPSASPQDSTTVDQPAPPLIPYVSLLHQEGERGALLRELHSHFNLSAIAKWGCRGGEEPIQLRFLTKQLSLFWALISKFPLTWR